jgi:hypothetical protein
MMHLKNSIAVRLAAGAVGLLVACMLVPAPSAAGAEGAAVTLEGLLKEMIDFDAVARWPDPPYTCRQASSYDRRSKTPSDPAGWFANNDWSQFIRSEETKGRREWVLMDAAGPGCVVRQWWGGKFPPKGAMLRFYLDGADEPAIEGPPFEILAGGALAPKPLSIENAHGAPGAPGGMNLYLPIPYAKHCKITYSEVNAKDPAKPPEGRWYNIEYRTYPAGTKVKTFTMAELKALGETVAGVCKTLDHPPLADGDVSGHISGDIEPGNLLSADLRRGPAAVRLFLFGPTSEEDEASDQLLRTTVLRIEFDNEESIWCPIGDFIGCGPSFGEVRSWYRLNPVRACVMYSRWVMPYQKSARISLLNLSRKKIGLEAWALVGPWKWDSRSMHFHANWRQERGIPTRPYKDWNYITIQGKGVYMGDTLALFNPVRDWWGEGDEKIWVDGESFPSHFGTGSEDYYGYSYGNPTVFQGPFSNQPRVDGPGNMGHTTNTRTRILDAIPFEKSLQMDMEIWHWADCKVNYAAATYWYALPGATSNRGPSPEEAAAPIPERPDRARRAKIGGAIECEGMAVVGHSPGAALETQDVNTLQFGPWSEGTQLFVRCKGPGDFVELKFPVAEPGAKKVTLYGTTSWDYGILRFSINGKPAAKEWDACTKESRASGPIELGVFEPKDGQMVLRVEVVGANPASKGTKSYFGLDCVVLSKP